MKTCIPSLFLLLVFLLPSDIYLSKEINPIEALNCFTINKGIYGFYGYDTCIGKEINIIDKEFLNDVETLRKEVTTKNEGVLKKLRLKFISKTNRYIVADEDIQKDNSIYAKPFRKLVNIENPSVRKFCKIIEDRRIFRFKNIYDNQ